MPLHPLTNDEIKKINNLPKIKDGTFVMNLDEFKSI